MTDFTGSGVPLTAQGVSLVQARLGVEMASLWAVIRVETSGCGFLRDRRPKILFERHVFRRQTQGRFDAVAPEVSGDAGGYGAYGAHQYERLGLALALDRAAALESCSWGLGQVMGYHAGMLGYQDVDAMVVAAVESEDAQMRMIGSFIANVGLTRALRARRWADFAHGYNGAGYAANRYDEKLAAAYAQRPLPDLTVRSAQVYLTYLGLEPGAIDGVMGPRTRAAIERYRSDADGTREPALDALLPVLP